jgi:uncharacterized protein (TIGR03086 family)
MSGRDTLAPLIGGVALLERAITYTLGSLRLVTPADLSRPTPCLDWDLHALLHHMDDSLTALDEALDTGQMALEPIIPTDDVLCTLRTRATRLLGAWTTALDRDLVDIAGCPLTTTVVMTAGAIEVAVHGWDVGQACRADRPLPDSLAEELLELSPLFVTEADRRTRFAAPVPLGGLAAPTDRLVAFLGRQP